MSELALDGGSPVRREPFPSVGSAAGRTLGAEEIAAVTAVIESGQLSRVGGTEVPALERDFAELLGARHAVASSSGTSAVHLAVSAVELEPGDEVIVPPITDFGTVIGVLAQNAVPIFADVDPLTGCMTAETVERVISDRTRAVIVVHLFGGGAPIDEIVQLARPRGIRVIEDCAQAYLTRPAGGEGFAGTRADIGCFSLQQSKHITAGDGGLTVTDDPEIDRHMRLFADKGWPRETNERTHLFHGFNYRMTELQGAVARAQLKKLPGVVQSRRDNARRLHDQVKGLSGLQFPFEVDRHSFWLLPFVVEPDILGADNKEFGKALVAEGIPVSAGYLERPVYLVPALVDRRVYGKSGFPFTAPPARQEIVYAPGDCPVAEDMINRTLLVMQWNEKFTDSDVDDIAAALTKVQRHFAS
ncbi:MAG TPA: DegT/DnrJ/EryC1/StrS family aminotransferase [Mycobacteriales bacterium]|nr:DegT/DnrJ/EryC1/StrS family aminotransferase [Mycobacteriales bacterium]